MLTTFVLVIHTLIAIALVGVILIQKSEGGALGIGSGPGGLLAARGAANFLTRATTVLATAFIITSIVLAVLAGYRHKTRTIDPSLPATSAPISTPSPGVPLGAPSGNDVTLVPGAPATEPAPTDEVPVAQ